ncbi:MAG: hypothetical protein QM530_07945 [Phycisphaerales bacterium]|nr:hypothetical protein [Phycisphaerales bacterium]
MKKILLLLLLSISVLSISAQKVYNSSGRKVYHKPVKQKGFNRDDLVLGGDFRFSLGQQLSLGIAPMAGYKLADNFYVGLRLGYDYNRVKLTQLPAYAQTNVFNFHCFSGSVWTRYLIMESIFIHTEFQYNVYNTYYLDDVASRIGTKYLSAPSVLVGLSFRQPISDRTSFNTTILYDVLNDPNSYYTQLLGSQLDFRLGFLVGF